MNAEPYLADLGTRLRGLGLPEEHVRVTLADLGEHLAECGGVPEEEFGPLEEFARELAPAAGRTAPDTTRPDPDAETWRWTADTFVDEELLGRFGDEGWEVERVDALGRFVCRRDRDRPQRWEYRRELVTRGREGLDERLAPDGWEACGNWLVHAWFKRPRAASLGPAAELPTPPPPPTRHTFRSRRFYAALALAITALTASGITAAIHDGGNPASGLGFTTGLLAGGVLPLALVLATHLRRGRHPQK
ncbi:hypothetical protein [Streptomyces lasiicapitis]|uniref:DUF2812 domain-containing protein n=1 Tax=Streptomyces lasiicapitis TaxID=1923961 RepID=A0ABQ2MDS1_9ACTN|nr:hypothetical protein [Streptomyces lasiicapitis]GGO49941.1 hypothetical protein GCM10012286_49070 [Streptomyces lasiicapitis]